MSTIIVDPTTRLEGHLGIEVELDATNKVINAKCSGTLFRGLENILAGRPPRDAQLITQRICGVCPISHGVAAALCLENTCGTVIPDNGRIMRNLIQSSNYLHSHIIHFYHLAALDYVKGPDMPPWTPRYNVDYRLTDAQNATYVQHYRDAITMRRKAHEMAAILGGKLPHSPAIVAGGCSENPESGAISLFQSYLTGLISFIENVYVPDVVNLATVYNDYYSKGVGCKNLLSYGVFDVDAAGNKLLSRGRILNAGSILYPVDPSKIAEYVKYSWYNDADSGLNPANGASNPVYPKTGAYTWLKAPRYDGYVYEVGPLARMWVNGDYRSGISVMDRHAARALEAKKIAYAMQGWLNQIVVTKPYYTKPTIPASASGMGLTEAPRGALGHWETLTSSVIYKYQCVVPTTWNGSPMDDMGQHGPIEQALIGTAVSDPNQPIELLRIIHAFDPCIACAVHMIKPNGEVKKFIV